jgi:adenine deaminase
MDLPSLLAVARGDRPADLVLRNSRVVNVLTGEIQELEVAVAGGRIAGMGEGLAGRQEVDLAGRYLCPGLIDAHVHIESSLVTPRQFARAVVPRGVTAVITDPHEIANVAGIAGVLFMLEDAATAPLAMFVNAPSCVPATALGSSGARLGATELAGLLAEPGVLGLAEMMDVPGVVRGDPSVLAKLAAFHGRILDGHCPGVAGRSLDAYAAAGISSDHESTAPEEAREKLRRGLTVFIREASNARNLAALLPLIDRWNERRLCFCTDDRAPGDLLDAGSVDDLVRRAVASGVDPLTALRLATLNPAEHYGLHDRGAIAPGRRADLVAFADLEELRADEVWVGGRLVARGGEPLFAAAPGEAGPVGPRDTVRVDWARSDLAIPAAGDRVRIIGLVPDQLVTESLVMDARIAGGEAVADPDRDLAKLAVLERHRASGAVGKGFVRGFGLRRGALAGTVAHDHHNLIVVGADDPSMEAAARGAAAAGGGLAVAERGEVRAVLALPIAGLMSDRPIEEVRRGLDQLLALAGELGCRPRNPFMALSFLGLEVIPALKLTDRGLVDVARQELVPLFPVEGSAGPAAG